MSTTYAEDNGGFLSLPRKDVGIIKPSFKAWTEVGNTVFGINAIGESICFQLIDEEGVHD